MFRLIGCLYLVSGLWCGFFPEKSAGFLEFELVSSHALAEFFSVYGGLQVGLGCAMLISSLIKKYTEAALFFSAIFSSGLLVFRLIALVAYSAAPSIIGMAVLEGVIALVLWWLWYQKSRMTGDL